MTKIKKLAEHINSHSTMYLLKQEISKVFTPTEENSHSTMYLLKLKQPAILLHLAYIFTFHHVSIKTE